jgi:hypothetical protein
MLPQQLTPSAGGSLLPKMQAVPHLLPCDGSRVSRFVKNELTIVSEIQARDCASGNSSRHAKVKLLAKELFPLRKTEIIAPRRPVKLRVLMRKYYRVY